MYSAQGKLVLFAEEKEGYIDFGNLSGTKFDNKYLSPPDAYDDPKDNPPMDGKENALAQVITGKGEVLYITGNAIIRALPNGDVMTYGYMETSSNNNMNGDQYPVVTIAGDEVTVAEAQGIHTRYTKAAVVAVTNTIISTTPDNAFTPAFTPQL
jgi:hypothetical protein